MYIKIQALAMLVLSQRVHLRIILNKPGGSNLACLHGDGQSQGDQLIEEEEINNHDLSRKLACLGITIEKITGIHLDSVESVIETTHQDYQEKKED